MSKEAPGQLKVILKMEQKHQREKGKNASYVSHPSNSVLGLKKGPPHSPTIHREVRQPISMLGNQEHKSTTADDCIDALCYWLLF
jgi:hypothetical protein